MYSALSLRLVAHRGIQRFRNVFIIIINGSKRALDSHTLHVSRVLFDRTKPRREVLSQAAKATCVCPLRSNSARGTSEVSREGNRRLTFLHWT